MKQSDIYTEALTCLRSILLADHPEFQNWIDWLERDIQDWNQRREVAHHLRAYGGMGSFNDLPSMRGNHDYIFDFLKSVCYAFGHLYGKRDRKSFVVDKANFLSAYKISEESGKLFMFNEFFQTEGDYPGTVYETEIGNKIYYSEKGERGNLDIFSKNKLLNEWSNGRPLPGSINESGNANYPFVLSDGVTIYYATDGEGLGGYDIFVTRYNTNTDSYLTPENVGMPFNSPYNDYMYVIDEYNNLGWFASDRFQPEEKVCIYVFIPNSSKQTYNYEAMDPQQMIRLAQIHSLKETWKDENTVAEALQRLKEAINHKPQERRVVDFEFVIDDNTTYYLLSDFQSPKAKQLFQSYRQLEKDYLQQEDKLDGLRQQYATANQQGKEKLAPAILDLEKRILQMNVELDALGVSVRNAEKTKSK